MENNTNENRFYKDTVFVDLFSQDINGKKNFLSLYNALFDTNLTDESKIQDNRLDQVMYMSLRNDISFLVEDRVIVLSEHQSTINENMPLRFLEYVARIYERLYDKRDKYARKLINIATPKFFVIYNGDEDYPVHKTLKLSDAYKEKINDISLELVVEVYNINKTKNNPLLEKCKPLKQYSQFVEIAKKFIKKDSRKGLQNAILYSIEQGILPEYLDRKSREVENMLVGEYCYEDDIAIQRAESRAIGKEEGISIGRLEEKQKTAKAFKKNGIDISTIAKCTGLSVEEVEKL